MKVKKSTGLALITLLATVWMSCSSKEDREKYDQYYGTGGKAREAAALVSIEATKKKVAETPIAISDPGPELKIEKELLAKGTSDSIAAATPAAEKKVVKKAIPAEISKLLNQHACLACHQPYDKIIGPPYIEVAKKKYSADKIVELVHAPKPENWPGFPPMAPMAHVPKADILIIANWINSL